MGEARIALRSLADPHVGPQWFEAVAVTRHRHHGGRVCPNTGGPPGSGGWRWTGGHRSSVQLPPTEGGRMA